MMSSGSLDGQAGLTLCATVTCGEDPVVMALCRETCGMRRLSRARVERLAPQKPEMLRKFRAVMQSLRLDALQPRLAGLTDRQKHRRLGTEAANAMFEEVTEARVFMPWA